MEQNYSYELKQEGQLLAYVRVTKAGVLLTPKKLSGAALNELQQSLEVGELPHGVVARKVPQARGFKREKPDWGELTVTPWKRREWLEKRCTKRGKN